jgi:hypothetical protein
MSPGSPAIMNGDIRSFSQSLQANAGMIPRLCTVDSFQVFCNYLFNNHEIIQRYTDNDNVIRTLSPRAPKTCETANIWNAVTTLETAAWFVSNSKNTSFTKNAGII